MLRQAGEGGGGHRACEVFSGCACAFFVEGRSEGIHRDSSTGGGGAGDVGSGPGDMGRGCMGANTPPQLIHPAPCTLDSAPHHMHSWPLPQHTRLSPTHPPTHPGISSWSSRLSDTCSSSRLSSDTRSGRTCRQAADGCVYACTLRQDLQAGRQQEGMYMVMAAGRRACTR